MRPRTLARRAALLLTSVWLIAGAALGTRVAFAWNQQRQIPHQALASVPFQHEAGNIAFALSQGDGFSNLFRQKTGPTAWLAPVYPFFLFLIFRFFGAFTLQSFFVAAGANILFSAAATFPLYAVARRAVGRGTAVAACWLWVVLPAGIMVPFEWIWETSLSVLLAVLCIWLALWLAESYSLKMWLVYGVLWALTVLTNPAIGVALPVLFVWVIWQGRTVGKKSLVPPLLAALLIVAICIPWTVRNYRAFHKLVPIRSSFAFELWIGNNDIFDENAVGGIQRITRFEETRRYARLGETAYLSEKWQAATSFIRRKPALFIRLSGRRFVATWTGVEHPVHDFRAADFWPAGLVIASNFLLALGSLAGAAFLLRSRSTLAVPLLVSPVLFPVVYYLTHTSLRYRHPIDPLLLLLTVVSGQWLVARRPARGDASAPAKPI